MSAGRAALGFGVAALVLGATGWLVVERGTDEAEADGELRAVTQKVERRTLRDVVVVRGSLRGRPLPPLVATGGGRVTAVHVEPGSVIEAGDRVFDVEAQPVIAVAGVFPYWRHLEQGATGPDVRQLEGLLVADGLAPGTVDDRFTRSTRRAVQEWQRRRGLPADGVFRVDRVLVAGWPVRVAAVHVAVGASITPEMELLEVATMRRMGDFRVSPSRRSGLAVGQSVTVTAASGGAEVQGEVAEIAAAPVDDEGAGEPTYPVVVDLDADPGDLPDGAALRGDVLVAEATDVWAVPVAAVRSDADGEPAVQVETSAGRRRLLPVELGLQEAGYVEVTAGLEGGERVVLQLR